MLHTIDFTSTVPRHQQVYDQLLQCIRDGYWQLGAKIPAELEIAAALGVAKLTVHRAVQALAKDGWVTRSVGRGTYVAPRDPKISLRRVLLAFGASATNVLGSDYYGKLYQGITDTLGTDTELILCPDSFGARSFPATDGILIIAPREDTLPSITGLTAKNIPTLVVGAHWPGLLLPAVDSDNVAAARQAVAHLAESGHKSITLVYSEPETANIRDRIAGFRAEAKARDLRTSELHAQAFWQLACEEKEALLGSLTQGVTAVFAAGYYLALDVLNILREAHYSVPGDISVVGFDDPVSAQLVYPPLTTLRQPLYEMGQHAAKRLAALTAGNKSEGSLELLPVALIVRDSTASPRT